MNLNVHHGCFLFFFNFYVKLFHRNEIEHFGFFFLSCFHSLDAESEVELPRTESDFEVIASSFGLLSPDKIPPEIQEGILNPKMFSERRLYLDPDIIGKPFISFAKITIL